MFRLPVATAWLAAVSAAAFTPDYVEEKKKECTFGGKVSEGCVALYTEVIAGDNPLRVTRDVEEKARSCFHDAAAFEKKLGDHAEAAEDLLRRQSARQPEVANKYVEACLEVTAALRGPRWLGSARQKAFYAKFKEDLDRDFETRCGLRADLASGDPPALVLWAKPVKKGTFFQGPDANGGTFTVLCNGQIQGKTKAGKGYKVAPLTIAQVRDAQSKSCRNNCEMNDALCVEGARRGRATPRCVATCKEKCR